MFAVCLGGLRCSDVFCVFCLMCVGYQLPCVLVKYRVSDVAPERERKVLFHQLCVTVRGRSEGGSEHQDNPGLPKFMAFLAQRFPHAFTW